MQAYSKEERERVRQNLHALNNTAEGHTLKEYIECRLSILAEKALSCDPDNLLEIQGRARMLEDMQRDLIRGTAVDVPD